MIVSSRLVLPARSAFRQVAHIAVLLHSQWQTSAYIALLTVLPEAYFKTPSSNRKQKLVYSILDFLQASMDDGSIKQDDKEGIEVASEPLSFPLPSPDGSQSCLSAPFILYLSLLDPTMARVTPTHLRNCNPTSRYTVQCIAEAFSIDTTNAAQTEALSIKPATLQSIFDVYLKTQAKQGSKTMPAPAASAGPSSVSSPLCM